MDSAQANFEGWAVVELFGHQREVGFVTTQAFGAAVLFRIDTPELPEREFVLTSPRYASEGWAQAGSKVRRESVPARTKLVGPSAIYALTPCTEKTARIALEELIKPPLILLEAAGRPALVQGEILSTEDAHDFDRVCEECGQTPEDGHRGDCSFFEEDEET